MSKAWSPDFPDERQYSCTNRLNRPSISTRCVGHGGGFMEHPAGESDNGALRVDFDRRLQLEFHGSRITSDAGLLAYRELDDALGLTDLAGGVLSDGRRGKN